MDTSEATRVACPRTGVVLVDATSPSLVLTPEDVADSISTIEQTYARPISQACCVCDGFGVRVVVDVARSKYTTASVSTGGPAATTGPLTVSAAS